MILYLNGHIDDSLVTSVISFVNNLPATGGTIYLNSTGGSVNHTQFIIDILNKHNDKITLTAGSLLASAAFMLFFSFKGSKSLLPGTVGMYHQGNTEYRTNDDGTTTYRTDQLMKKNRKKLDYQEDLRLMKSLKFTKKEQRLFKGGQDVCFSNKRMCELLTISNKK